MPCAFCEASLLINSIDLMRKRPSGGKVRSYIIEVAITWLHLHAFQTSPNIPVFNTKHSVRMWNSRISCKSSLGNRYKKSVIYTFMHLFTRLMLNVIYSPSINLYKILLVYSVRLGCLLHIASLMMVLDRLLYKRWYYS